MAVRFSAADHAYYLDGQPVPSVTQLLAAAGWIDDQWFTERAAARGTDIHALCAADDLGESGPVGPDLSGYLASYRAAMAVLRPTWAMVEQPLAHPVYRYAGTPDRVGAVLDGLTGIVDIKSGLPMRSHPIQLALYAILVADECRLPYRAIQRFGVYLKSNGKMATVTHYQDPHDFDAALKLLKGAR